ncbi:MAG: AAA family ATPase [Flexistipes sinusarabici]|uniref:Chromosome partition protein Smc n=1 Tax=Flexistipes sinusarabici TaxID=2352 RepID=A0A5D0MQ36_FLESI|nr:AAA family ATPase [Flexistipes sinusarabici]TYB33710.1 MAG: AAA family ATPase [Flexistipes sinusarabici]
MIFKRITLQGFKSFVERTDIDFPKGVTCIVGPNGSGKSNILDAIRWVFGEQSAKELRGSEMEDIVFAGSENRKSSGFAQVSLTLGDLDDETTAKWGTLSEITVSRKYYKTGEREYLINNRKCKLKDIKEIFYDTGIGARSISIIEQGKVEKIIQSSPEELRLFFEETAGVVKFKERKKEAEKRLSQTKDNLGRVNDIIAEVRQNTSVLYEQLQKLNNYKELKDSKKHLDFSYLFNSYNELREKLSKLNKNHDDSLLRINEKNKALDNFRNDLNKRKTEFGEKQNEYKKCNETLIDLIEKINKCEADIKVLESNIESSEHTKIQLKEEIETDNSKLRELTDESQRLKNLLEELEVKKGSIQEKIDEINDILSDLQLQKEDNDDDLAECREIYLDFTQKITELRNEIYKNETEYENTEKNIKKLRAEQKEIDDNTEELGAEKDRLTGLIDDKKNDCLLYVEKLDDFNAKLRETEEKLNVKAKEMEDIRIEHSITKRTLELLQTQLKTETFADERDEKYFHEIGAKFLVDFLPGQDTEVLKEFGDVLVLKGKDSNSRKELLDHINGLKGSYRFVFEKELDSFEKFLLETSFESVTSNIIKFEYIFHKFGEKDKNALVLKLKNDIKTAESDISRISSSLEEKDSEYNNLKNKKETITSEIEKLAKIKEALDQEINKYENELSTVLSDISRDRRRTDVLEKELKLNSEELGRLKSENKNLTARLEEISGKQESYNEEMEELEEKSEFFSSKIDEYKDQLSDLKIEIRGYSEQISGINKQKHYVDKDISTTSNKIAGLKNRLKKLMTVDVSNWQTGLESKKKYLKKYKSEKIQNEDIKKFFETEIEELHSRVEELENSINEQKDAINKEEREYERLHYSIMQTKSELKDLQERYEEKYQGSNIYNDLRSYETKDFKPRVIKNKIADIEKKIEELGPLNMAADNEYYEAQERLDFLLKQREDLENAIGTIYELIREIDDSTIKQFKQTFESVRKHFLDIFKILFGEGKAELKLSDENDLLTTGVEIFVQPPGKRLQNMNLLSGGEKAMTACTLLFAMFLHKPTPFCFLDEIDAPLDDANVNRFVKIVKELSKKSQFVIISHNQKTIENADSLYGVTMQEPGVSKILSVTLDKHDLKNGAAANLK